MRGVIDMKLTVLIENTAAENSRLTAEHGLSLLIETRRKKFLFDCGHTGAAWRNARTLNIDLRGINFVALSHAHYDHAGGFPSLLEFAPIDTVYTGENFWDEKFSRDDLGGVKYRGCGFDENFLATRRIKQIICRDVTELDSDAWLIGNFRRRYDFETIPKKFVRGEEKIPDDFRDEIALILRERDGLAIVTACAHSGILNIVADVRERLKLPVTSVIGGLHLTGASSDRISRTLDELKILGVRKILPCHCSGEELIQRVGSRLSTGEVVEL